MDMLLLAGPIAASMKSCQVVMGVVMTVLS